MFSMNRLNMEKRLQILSMLCEGSSMRSISRVADVSINTVAKLLVDAGLACAAFHDETVRDVKARRVQVDEIWSFTAAKQKNVPAMRKLVAGAGDTWTWTAIEADTKMIVSWLVGGRDSEYAMAFMDDLRSGLADAFSKKFENHMHMVALYTVWYNFVKLHKAHRMTPAMAAGVSDRLWSMEDIAALVEAAAPKPGPRGPYKKQPAVISN
jgi:lambda repressor-like predicted transcriptional regulator